MKSTLKGNAEVHLVVSAHELRILRSALIEAMEAVPDDHNFYIRVGARRSESEKLLKGVINAQRLLRGTPEGNREGYTE